MIKKLLNIPFPCRGQGSCMKGMMQANAQKERKRVPGVTGPKLTS